MAYKLENLLLSVNIYTQDEIDQLLRAISFDPNILSNKIDISGSNNIGTLNLSGNLESGFNSKAVSPNSNALGYDVTAGTKSFKIVGGQFSEGTFQVSANLNDWK